MEVYSRNNTPYLGELLAIDIFDFTFCLFTHSFTQREHSENQNVDLYCNDFLISIVTIRFFDLELFYINLVNTAE